MEPMMNATGPLYGTSNAQEYPTVGSGPAVVNKGPMNFEQSQIVQPQHMNSTIPQIQYGQHQIINQTPTMYQVCSFYKYCLFV